MALVLKQKSWVWKLTLGFASNNYTTIKDTLYYPKGQLPSAATIRHEEVHARQQKEVGLIKYLFLYLFAFPLFWNPWRYKWELEAYKQNLTQIQAKSILKSRAYGWLRNGS